MQSDPGVLAAKWPGPSLGSEPRKEQESLWTWRHLPRKAGWLTVCQGLNPGVGYLSMNLELSGDKIHQNTAVSQC